MIEPKSATEAIIKQTLNSIKPFLKRPEPESHLVNIVTQFELFEVPRSGRTGPDRLPDFVLHRSEVPGHFGRVDVVVSEQKVLDSGHVHKGGDHRQLEDKCVKGPIEDAKVYWHKI